MYMRLYVYSQCTVLFSGWGALHDKQPDTGQAAHALLQKWVARHTPNHPLKRPYEKHKWGTLARLGSIFAHFCLAD